MKTAIIQVNAVNNKEKNIEKARRMACQAVRNKAKFILLPEAFNYRADYVRKNLVTVAENFPGQSTRPFLDIAKKHRVYILAGSICERIANSKKVYNTSVLIDPKGNIIAKYRKIHLFNAKLGKAKLRESLRISKGGKPVISKVGAWALGHSICYDLRFPEMYWQYARKGADMLCVPSAFTKITGLAHWEVLLRARAIENLCYVLAPNQIGKDGQGVASYGNSMIIDPWGKILARASGNKEEIIYAHLDKKILKQRRAMLPVQRK